MNRTCDGCSECCKGWLIGEAHGHSFYPGKPCFFLNKTCSIYDNRPENPCKSYKCHWLASDDLPMWMRPDLCNAIVTQRENDEFCWVDVVECGKKMDSSTLSWLVIWALNNGKNLKYQVGGGWNKIGSNEFVNSNV